MLVEGAVVPPSSRIYSFVQMSLLFIIFAAFLFFFILGCLLVQPLNILELPRFLP